MPVFGHPARTTVLYEEEHPAEVYIEPEQEKSSVGRIIIGKVESVEAGLSAAFIRIAPDQRVYMPLAVNGDTVRPGDEFPVQIRQEAQKTKLPKVSPQWEITGIYMVVTPGVRKTTYSRKLAAEQKKELSHISAAWEKDDCGILFRTRAAGADPDELKNEFLQIQKTINEIQQKAVSRPCYAVLYEAPGIQHEIIQRCSPGELKRFLTDDEGLAASVRNACDGAGCDAELYQDPQLALYRLRSLSGLLDHLTSSIVPLRSGGSLIIEQTEAFAVIDVNTARYTGRKDHAETVRRINSEAAYEAARQIRLRQLSGTILIDFINSTDPKEEAGLAQIMESVFYKDPVYTKVVDFTKLHICEITRKKIHRSLKEQIFALKEKV